MKMGKLSSNSEAHVNVNGGSSLGTGCLGCCGPP